MVEFPMDCDLPSQEMDPQLYEAAETGDMKYFEKANDEDSAIAIPFKATSQLKRNALHIAAYFKRRDFADRLVASFPELLTRADLRGDSPLHIAARTGCEDMVACFLKSEKAEEAVGMKNKGDDTALHIAVRHGHLQVVKILVEKNSKLLDLVNSHKESPLYLAVERGFFEIAEFMLEQGSNSSVCSCEGTKGMTALHAAVIRTHRGFELGKPIADLSLSVNGLFKGKWDLGLGRQPSPSGHEVPELSLEKLRRVVTKLFFRVRGYFKGKRSDVDIDIMEVLFSKKKDEITKADEFGWTPLHYAAYLGHYEATEKLLKFEKSVAGLLDKEGSCALHIAAKKGHTDIMEEIIKFQPGVYNLFDRKGRTILHVAAQYGNSRVVKYILKKPNLESIINEPDNDGNTPLHLAAIYGHYGVVILLAVDHRVDKRAMNNEYLKTIDIVQSNMDIGEIIKYWIMRKLEHAGGRQSLHRLVIRENANVPNGENGGGYQENNTNMPTDNIKENNTNMQPENTEENNTNMQTDNIECQKSSNSIFRSSSNTSTQSSSGMSSTTTTSNMSIIHDRNKEIKKEKELRTQRLKQISNTHLLVATLIATVTFAAGFSLPGGFNEEGPNKGKAVFSTNLAFKAFMLSDGIAFYCSTAAVFLHFFASLEQNYHLLLRFIKFSAILTYVSILGMVIAFTSGVYLVLPNSSELSTSAFVLGCLFLGFYIFGVL